MPHDLETERLLKLTERSMQRGQAELLDEIQERRRKQQEQTGARKRPGKGKQ